MRVEQLHTKTMLVKRAWVCLLGDKLYIPDCTHTGDD